LALSSLTLPKLYILFLTACCSAHQSIPAADCHWRTVW